MILTLQEIEAAVQAIQQKAENFQPEIAMILGSGMGVMAAEVEDPITIPYSEIPGFPVSTVKGHAGRLVLGTLAGKKVVIMQGRVHYYEGHPIQLIAFPVRVMNRLGAHTLVVTNAAGAVNLDFEVGDLMIIRDHINFTFRNPLTGPNLPSFGSRFPDNSATYSPELVTKAWEVAKELKVSMKEGVYLFNMGPSYETPAEIQVAKTIGADAVGMSTFPEALAANHAGMRVFGMSMITNLGAGLSDEPPKHTEVLEVFDEVKHKILPFIRGLVRNL